MHGQRPGRFTWADAAAVISSTGNELDIINIGGRSGGGCGSSSSGSSITFAALHSLAVATRI